MSVIKLTSPNAKLYKCQKAFRVRKTRPSEGATDVRVSDIFKNDLIDAAKNLNGIAFKIYIYLISNQENYVGGLSRTDITSKLGISSKSYDNGIKELKEKGYFIYSNQQVNDNNGEIVGVWDFFARPHP